MSAAYALQRTHRAIGEAMLGAAVKGKPKLTVCRCHFARLDRAFPWPFRPRTPRQAPVPRPAAPRLHPIPVDPDRRLGELVDEALRHPVVHPRRRRRGGWVDAWRDQ